MKPQLPFVLVATLAAGLLSSCADLPVGCCPFYRGDYRPFGQPASPTEAYRAGYVAGEHDRQEKERCNWAKHSAEVPMRYHAYAQRGYADGFAGRVQIDWNSPQSVGNPTSERFTKYRRASDEAR